MFKLAVLLAAMCLGASAQFPVKCQSPSEWEAFQIVYDSVRGYERRGFYAYDLLGQRKAHREIVQVNDTRGFYHNIELFKENVMYTIDRRSGTCTKSALKRPFRPHAIAADAQFDGDLIMGTSAYSTAGIEISRWSFKDNATEYSQVYTKVDCLPITEAYIEAGNTRVETFVDITLGLNDPNIFIPPPNCV